MSPKPLPDERVARRATRHHGLVTRSWALACGLTDRQMALRVRSGRWIRLAPGVYRIHGAPLTPTQQSYAAVLAAGEEALVGGLSALALLGIATAPARPSITVPPSASARSRLAIVRRSIVDVQDRTMVGPVPCVTAARAIVEVSRREPAGSVAPLLDSAIHRDLARPATVLGALRRAGGLDGRPGARRLVDLLEPWTRGVTPGSPGETRLLRRLVDWGFPRPSLQHEVLIPTGIVRLDVAWPDRLVGLEYDGAEYHGPRQLEHDVAREEQLRASGWWIGRVDRFDLEPSSTRLRDVLAARLVRSAA